AVARLHRDGLIHESATRPDEVGTSRWRYYRLSQLGRRVLLAELDRLESILCYARERGLRGAPA
ncbi:MAG: hypothetical protein MI919_35800, partial [Holophagales bacterium]|nr:hypothetical protein [Holophagales bacterium]